MTLLMRDRENFEKGVEIGQEKGIEIGQEIGQEKGADRMGHLTKLLLKEKRYSDLDRAAEDKKYREDLFKKYQI